MGIFVRFEFRALFAAVVCFVMAYLIAQVSHIEPFSQAAFMKYVMLMMGIVNLVFSFVKGTPANKNKREVV